MAKVIFSLCSAACIAWGLLAGAQNLGMNCADECQSKLNNCRASCKAVIIHKRLYNRCMDTCDDQWRDCRNKCG